ncbi:MAG: glycoside hydrolase family 125 protein [Firmicutes bacterium]|nr:glycoside hydrolase family 125 protein [Bacillota bacterium]
MIDIPEVLLKQADELERYWNQRFPALGKIVKGCFLNTIETTVHALPDGSCFVITGDIDAMWLRDSAAQVGLYVRFAKDDASLQKILEGVIASQMRFVNIDPYANAFNPDDSDPDRGWKDETDLTPHIWERKYEVDSLCAPLYLSYDYYQKTGIGRIFTEEWKNAAEKILTVFETEQRHADSPYFFRRHVGPESDTLPGDGYGNPVGYTGMTWSGFRPSDDRCIYGYLIPSNMMAVCALQKLSEIADRFYPESSLSVRARKLEKEIREGIEKYGLAEDPDFGAIYAYEVDGLGHRNLMDDANSPSLLAIPYLGFAPKEDAIYQNTRRFILSRKNPYYYEGKYARGIGSPHTPRGYIWHISLIMQALTSSDPDEIQGILQMLADTLGGTDFMHESFNPDSPDRFTRSWFAWANTLFAQLMDDLRRD